MGRYQIVFESLDRVREVQRNLADHGVCCEEIDTALAASERDERAERLGLPWSYAEGEDGWYVHFSKGNPRPHDYCEYEQARLMASAPDLAGALENLIEDNDPVVKDEAISALNRCGWLK